MYCAINTIASQTTIIFFHRQSKATAKPALYS